MRRTGKSIGRRVITSTRLMALLPIVGAFVGLVGAVSLILGIAAIATGTEPLLGVALVTMGAGQLLTGAVLFLAMCVLQDLLGIL